MGVRGFLLTFECNDHWQKGPRKQNAKEYQPLLKGRPCMRGVCQGMFSQKISKIVNLNLQLRSNYFFRALWWNILGLIFIVTLCCLDGLVIFAVYSDCDLKKAGHVTNNDQVY